MFSKYKYIFESNTTSKILADSSIRFLYSSTLPIKLPLDHANTNFNQNFFSPSPSVFQTRVSIYSRIFHKFHFPSIDRINLHINRGLSWALGWKQNEAIKLAIIICLMDILEARWKGKGLAITARFYLEFLFDRNATQIGFKTASNIYMYIRLMKWNCTNRYCGKAEIDLQDYFYESIR